MKLILEDHVKLFTPYDEEFFKPLLNKDFENSLYTSWLKESPPKRCIFWHLYQDLLKKNEMKVLDVGGGITPYTYSLKKNCKDYVLCDILAHDQFLRPIVENFLYENDWFLLDPKPVDIIIANDIFPNADQRLDLFLDKFIPFCKEIRMTVTFYNYNRFYIVQRLDAEEKLVFQAYNGEQCHNILMKYTSRIKDFDQGLFDKIFYHNSEESLYKNKRHVALFTIFGDLNSKSTPFEHSKLL